MKASIGYTVSLNIVIVFIVIVFAFIGGSISYYKAYKVNSLIEDEIEKYEGFNELSKKEIDLKLRSLGYDMSKVNCGKQKVTGSTITDGKVSQLSGSGNGYCVYYNIIEVYTTNDSFNEDVMTQASNFGSGAPVSYNRPKRYNYLITTYLRFNIPIINKLLKIPIYTRTNAIYACYGGSC